MDPNKPRQTLADRFATVVRPGLIMGLVWWSANKVTWDCTYVGEDGEETGTGLLRAAGLDSDKQQSGASSENDADTEDEATRKADKRDDRLTWWERYQRYREQRKKKRT